MPSPTSPALPWEVVVRWGNQRLSTEIVDAKRPVLVLADDAKADVVTGHPARVELRWVDDALEVAVPEGVAGAWHRQGDWPVSLEDARAKGLLSAGGRLVLGGRDEAQLNLGKLAVELRRSRGPRWPLPFDVRWLAPAGLALFAIALMLASLVAPDEGPKLRWLKPAGVMRGDGGVR